MKIRKILLQGCIIVNMVSACIMWIMITTYFIVDRKPELELELELEEVKFDYQSLRKYHIAGSDGFLYVVSRDYCFYTEEAALDFMGDSYVVDTIDNKTIQE